MSATLETSVVPPARPLYWICQVAGWALWCVAGILMARQQFGRITGDMLVGYGLFFFFSIGVTHGLRHVMHRHGWLNLPAARALGRLAAAVIVVGFLLAGFVALVALLKSGANSDFRRPAAFVLLLVNLTFGAALWTILYVAVSTWLRHRTARHRAAALERSLAAARLKTLEAQISPHFLFNCLNSLRGMIAENPVHAQDMVTRLANILRHNLTRGREVTTEPLAEQVEIVTDYLALETVRFEERLRTRMAVDPAVARVEIPAMLLQTLVENAIKHGIAQLPDGGEVVITARPEGEVLCIDVENTGALGPSSAPSTRVGLANLRERLAMLYGSAASLELLATAPDRVSARVRLPVLRGNSTAPESGAR